MPKNNDRPAGRFRSAPEDSPTAQRILGAAKRILTERGYAHVTLKEIEDESGEFRALVAYYFGNKRGLLQAVVDSLMEDEDTDLRQRLEEISDPEARVDALLDAQRSISADWLGFRAFDELLPHIMHDDSMRARLAESYRSSRELDRRCFEGEGRSRHGRSRPAGRPERGRCRRTRGPVRRRPRALRPRRHLPLVAAHDARLAGRARRRHASLSGSDEVGRRSSRSTTARTPPEPETNIRNLTALLGVFIVR